MIVGNRVVVLFKVKYSIDIVTMSTTIQNLLVGQWVRWIIKHHMSQRVFPSPCVIIINDVSCILEHKDDYQLIKEVNN